MVQSNLIAKGHVYGFGVKGSKLKRMAQLCISTLSSSINNYDAYEMVTQFNESVFYQLKGKIQSTC